MVDIDLKAFTDRLKCIFAQNMPYLSGDMVDKSLGKNDIIPLGLDGYYFEIGNETAEKEAPHYHILEDSQVITKRGRGTKSSKGSQAFIQDKGKRDYGIAQFKYDKYNEKKKHTPYYEYKKNVRGERSRIGGTQTKIVDSNGRTTYINRESNTYLNIHYKYIEKILEMQLPLLAQEFGLRTQRTSIDYEQEYESWLADNFLV